MAEGYGEPWRLEKYATAELDVRLYLHRAGTEPRPIGRLAASFSVGDAERIVACVNALAGLNPGALGELLEACDELARDLSGKSYNGSYSVLAGKGDDFVAVLAKLREVRA